jgi:hypothetical protein
MMDTTIIAKYLGSSGNGYKFEDDHYRTIIFPRSTLGLRIIFQFLNEENVNKFFKIEYEYEGFDKNSKVINDLSLIKGDE